MTKETFYDANIRPLMTQIIALCKEGDIAMLADFALDWDDDEQTHLKCTTVLLSADLNPPDEMLKAARILRPLQRSPIMMTVQDGDGNVKEMHAIL